MRRSKTYPIDQLRDYSSLFSRAEVNRWYKNDWSSLRKKIERYDSVVIKRQENYLSYLKKVYRVIERFYPNEYVYKNEFIGRWLLREIGLADSVLFSEFRLGKAVADLAMFNGVSKVFEIKTLLDKETRLDNQLQQYNSLFNEVYLVVPESKIHVYQKRDASTGIICYDHAEGSFSLIRPAVVKADIDVNVLMQVLHTHEYITIVEQYLGYRPALDDFNKFAICSQLIRQIPADLLSKQFVTLMKERKMHNSFSKKDAQFNQLFLAMNYSHTQKRQLLSNLSTTIS